MSVVDSNSKNNLSLQFPSTKTTNFLSKILKNNVSYLDVKMATPKERKHSPRNLSLQLLDFPRAHCDLDSERNSNDGDQEQELAEKSQAVKWTVFGSLMHLKSRATKHRKSFVKRDSHLDASEDSRASPINLSFRGTLPIATPTFDREIKSSLIHQSSIKNKINVSNNERSYKETTGPSPRRVKPKISTIIQKIADKDEEALLLNTIRRKSCHCNDCGDLSKLEKKHLNTIVSSKRAEFNQEKVTLKLKCPEEIPTDRTNSAKRTHSFRGILPSSKLPARKGSKIMEAAEKLKLLSSSSFANLKPSHISVPDRDNAVLSKFSSLVTKESLELDPTKVDQLKSQIKVLTKEDSANEEPNKINRATPALSSRTSNKANLMTNESDDIDVSFEKKTPSLENFADVKPEKVSDEDITEEGSIPCLGFNSPVSPTQKTRTERYFMKKVDTFLITKLNPNKKTSISLLSPHRNGTVPSPPENQATPDKIRRINKNSVIVSRRAKNQCILATYTNTSSTLFSPSSTTTKHLAMANTSKIGETTPTANRRLVDPDFTSPAKIKPLNLNSQVPLQPLNLDTKRSVDFKHGKTKTATAVSNSRDLFQGIYSSRETTSQPVLTGRSSFLLARHGKKKTEIIVIPSLVVRTEPNEVISGGLETDKKRKTLRTKTVKHQSNSISLEGLKRSYRSIRNQTFIPKSRDIY